MVRAVPFGPDQTAKRQACADLASAVVLPAAQQCLRVLVPMRLVRRQASEGKNGGGTSDGYSGTPMTRSRLWSDMASDLEPAVLRRPLQSVYCEC